jgi:hypothetical protein
MGSKDVEINAEVPEKPKKGKMSAAAISELGIVHLRDEADVSSVPIWIALSSTVILYNSRSRNHLVLS